MSIGELLHLSQKCELLEAELEALKAERDDYRRTLVTYSHRERWSHGKGEPVFILGHLESHGYDLAVHVLAKHSSDREAEGVK